ncbi:hypothetical protein ACWCWD_27460 [Streptomyces sp. NPDC001493]
MRHLQRVAAGGTTLSHPGAGPRSEAAAGQIMDAPEPVRRTSAEPARTPDRVDHGRAHTEPAPVQRVPRSTAAEEPASRQAEQPPGEAEVIARLSESIEQHTVQEKTK